MGHLESELQYHRMILGAPIHSEAQYTAILEPDLHVHPNIIAQRKGKALQVTGSHIDLAQLSQCQLLLCCCQGPARICACPAAGSCCALEGSALYNALQLLLLSLPHRSLILSPSLSHLQVLCTDNHSSL